MTCTSFFHFEIEVKPGEWYKPTGSLVYYIFSSEIFKENYINPTLNIYFSLINTVTF